MGVARTLSMLASLKWDQHTHILASVEPPSYARKAREPGQLRIVSILQIFTGLPWTDFTVECYSTVWYWRPNESSPHPDVLLYRSLINFLTTASTVKAAAELDSDQVSEPGTRHDQLIPVVTFLAPLASNFEGLKDR